MCFAILGLKVPGIKIKNPACVKKTFPNFFQKLAAPPPQGLGATILDAKTGRKLEVTRNCLRNEFVAASRQSVADEYFAALCRNAATTEI